MRVPHLLLVADMGHDLPRPLWPVIVGAMNGLAATPYLGAPS